VRLTEKVDPPFAGQRVPSDTENGCGKNSLFSEQAVKLIVAIAFARKAQ